VNRHKVVLSLITRDNDYQLEQAKSADSVAEDRDVELEILYADSNSATQNSQLLDATHTYKSGLSAILVEPAGGTEFPQAAQAAVSAGIAWVVLNRDASSLMELRGKFALPIFAVSSDHTQVGRIQAEQLAAMLPESAANVLCIQGPSGVLAAQQRLTGLRDALASGISLEIVESTNWTEDGGYQAACTWLEQAKAREPAISAVVGQNDSLAIGARQAFEQAKKLAPGSPWSHLPFLGVDGLPRTGQAFVNSGALAATVVVPPVAGPALETVLNALASKTVPPEMQLVPSRSYPALESLRPIWAATH
jgi:ribose transport system substrate-binding protein